MAKQNGAQRRKVEQVMHEFKEGDLESGGGRKVRNPKQAIAIALSEAGASNQQSPDKNRQHRKEAERSETRAELYEQAKRKDIPGRSRMSKAELQRALA